MQDDVRAQIKHIKIFTKRLISNLLAGEYLSAFKGVGMEFHQIREYSFGDDSRSIDWNSSVRTNKLMIKQFVEERDRTIILMIDISSSSLYASNIELKKELIAKVASTLALVSDENNDKVAAIFFSDVIEKWIMPGRGPVHINNILETIFTVKPKNKKTNITEALKFLINFKKHGLIVFMISDFIDNQESYAKLLKVASCKHDFIGIRIIDACEREMPDVGFLEVSDSETGENLILDTKGLSSYLNQRFNELSRMFDKYRIDLLTLNTNKPFTMELIKFFRKRTHRSI